MKRTSSLRETAYSICCGAFQRKARMEKLSKPSFSLFGVVAGEGSGAETGRGSRFTALAAARVWRKRRRGSEGSGLGMVAGMVVWCGRERQTFGDRKSI